MFGFSMIQMVRAHADKLDLQLREKLIHLYSPFKWTPCFLHSSLENYLKKNRQFPVIVEFEGGCVFSESVSECARIASNHKKSKVVQGFPSVGCCRMDACPNALEELLSNSSSIKKIYYDREVQAFLDVATPSTGASGLVRQQQQLTGKGVKIAILDTGIYPHKDLEGRIVGFADFINGRTEPYDDNGHGTHCAGDAAGNGAASEGKYRGPAPKAELIGVKVLDRQGAGSLSTIMAGVEWCLQYNQSNPASPIRIMSLSLGSDPQRYPAENDDPMVRSVEAAWNSGVVVCVAAGNSGPDAGTIGSPGISDEVITVGAMDDTGTTNRADDTIAVFSSRGPTIYGKAKPDVVAPGVDIISLRSPNSYLDKLQKSNRVGTDYFTLSGTSMATPICAGLAALMLENNPALTPVQVKLLLIQGAEPRGDINTYGKGYVNIQNSIPQ